MSNNRLKAFVCILYTSVFHAKKVKILNLTYCKPLRHILVSLNIDPLNIRSYVHKFSNFRNQLLISLVKRTAWMELQTSCLVIPAGYQQPTQSCQSFHFLLIHTYVYALTRLTISLFSSPPTQTQTPIYVNIHKHYIYTNTTIC